MITANIKKAHLAMALMILTVFFTPFFVIAQGASSNTGITYECEKDGPVDSSGNVTKVYGDCDFTDVVNAIKRMVDWGIIFALQFSVIVIAYAGFNYMISGDNASKRATANKMLLKVAIGIAWIIGAWLVVTLIANALLKSNVLDVVPLG